MKMELMAPKITKMVFAFPKNTSTFEEDMAHFDDYKLKRVKEQVGINKRYFTDDNTFASDLCVVALKEAIVNNKIDALMVVTSTPDYLLPKLSDIISFRLGLKSEIICLDIVGLCNGFLTALVQASMLLSHCERVAIVCTSVKSKSQDPNNKIGVAITTDSASATILESSDEKMYFMENTFLEQMMEMTTHYSAYKKGDKYLTTNDLLTFNKFSEHFPQFYKNFLNITPKAGINILHSPNRFFLERAESENGIKFFNKTLNQFGSLFINDIPMNVALAKDEMNFKDKIIANLVGHGTGTTLSVINMPICNFESKILFI